MRSFIWLVRAGHLEFVRDRAALFWTLAFPLIFIFVFGLAFGRDQGASYNVGLVVADDSNLATLVSYTIEGVEAFDVSRGELDSELEELREGNRRAVLVIPTGFGESWERGDKARVAVHFDATQQTTVQVVVPMLQRALEIADREATGRHSLILPELHALKSQRLTYLDFIIPGIVAMSIMNAGIFGAVELVSMRERRVLRRLRATPISRVNVLGAGVLVRLVVLAFQTALLVVVARIFFGLRPIENMVGLVGMVALGGLAFLAIGFFIGAFAKTEQAFFPLAQVLTFPMMFLSGIFFPIEVMPDWIQPLIGVLPLTFLADGVRQVMVGSTPLHALVLNVAVLAAFLAVFLVLAIRTFRWE